jgi:hypothetical protein
MPPTMDGNLSAEESCDADAVVKNKPAVNPGQPFNVFFAENAGCRTDGMTPWPGGQVLLPLRTPPL